MPGLAALALAAVAAGLAVACTAAPVAAGVAGVARHPAAPGRLYGVTVDELSDPAATLAALSALPERPTVRLVLDPGVPARRYLPTIRRIEAAGGQVMAELLDSSAEKAMPLGAAQVRFRQVVRILGGSVAIWEIGNELNGNWTGPYGAVEAKLLAAYQAVAAAGGRSALTLYENARCGDGAGELSPVAFSARYVPAELRAHLAYVFLSYYEDQCGGIRPSAARWRSRFAQLHALYPHALVGFGEIGLARPATASTEAQAASTMRYYYGLRLDLGYFVGGYFWWYFREDCVPSSKPLWHQLDLAFAAEAGAGAGASAGGRR